jgi:hypothetical protein
MAIHPDLKSMLRESLVEYLHVAEYCVGYTKDVTWSREMSGGCLGYPAAVMMFAIVDAIGSYYRGNRTLSMSVDGRSVSIRTDGFQHFYILNSEYYAQTLSASTIKSLYGRFRSLLVHNAALAPGSFLVSFSGQHVSFPVSDDRQCVNLPPFLELSKRAVGVFLERLDTVVPRSDQARNLSMKQRLTGHLTTGSG